MLISVSCAAAGTCSAGGYYTSISGDQQAFVVNESIGIWCAAKEVAGALNKGVLLGEVSGSNPDEQGSNPCALALISKS